MIGAHKSPRFKADLNDHALYLADHNPDTALKFVDAVEYTIDLIATQPFMGAERVFESVKVELRMHPVSGFDNFLIFYQPFEKGLFAIRLLHGSRDIQAVFE